MHCPSHEILFWPSEKSLAFLEEGDWFLHGIRSSPIVGLFTITHLQRAQFQIIHLEVVVGGKTWVDLGMEDGKGLTMMIKEEKELERDGDCPMFSDYKLNSQSQDLRIPDMEPGEKVTSYS